MNAAETQRSGFLDQDFVLQLTIIVSDILTVNRNIVLFWGRIEMRSLWPQIQMCLTSEQDSVVLSSCCKIENCRQIHWFLLGIVKGVIMDNRVSFIPFHSEFFNRCYLRDLASEGIGLVFLHYTIRGIPAHADFLRETLWKREIFKHGHNIKSVLAKHANLL